MSDRSHSDPSHSDPSDFDHAQLNIAGRLGKAAMFTNMTPLISLLIFLIGALALVVTPREENPHIDVPAANVIVRMQGASPEEVQNLIVRPLEMILREMTGVDHTYGMAMNSQAVVTVMFNVGEDKEASLVKLYDRIMHNLDRLPAGASEPLVKPMDVDDVPVSVITLSSGDMDGLSLKRLAERVRDQLSGLDGVSVADIIGGNWPVPMPVATQVGRLIVGTSHKKPVYLRDVATITDGASETDAYHRIGFGQSVAAQAGVGAEELPAVSITLAKKRGTNAVVVTHRIEEKLNALKGDFIPDNVHATITRDSGERANAAVNLLLEHLGIAIATVIIILLLFLGWREAAIVTMNIPLILFIVLAVGMFAGQSIKVSIALPCLR